MEFCTTISITDSPTPYNSSDLKEKIYNLYINIRFNLEKTSQNLDFGRYKFIFTRKQTSILHFHKINICVFIFQDESITYFKMRINNSTNLSK